MTFGPRVAFYDQANIKAMNEHIRELALNSYRIMHSSATSQSGHRTKQASFLAI